MEEKGVWRTISGRRVFIREGEDLASAMKRSGKFKGLTEKAMKIVAENPPEFQKATKDYKREKAYRNYVKKTLNNDDEFEGVSKQLKDISNRTGGTDLFSEAGKKWNELYKQDKNNVSKDLGNGYSMKVGYSGDVYISGSHPYDNTDYAYAEKKNNKWEVRNPISKERKMFNSSDEALNEMKKIDKYIQIGEKSKDYEGITHYKALDTEIKIKKLKKEDDISPMSEYSDTTGTGYSDRQMKAYKDYLQRKHGTTDESIINAGKEKENRVSIEKFANGELPKPTYTKSGKIDYKSFGIERTPESDFSDDGTRFKAYMLPNGMEMTVAKDDSDIYMSVRHPYDKEISYEEYSNLPHYKDLDRYNGVRANSVDLDTLIKDSNEYMKAYNELKKSKGLQVDNRSNFTRRIENMNEAINSAQKSYEYHLNNNDYSRWRYHRSEANKAKTKELRLKEKRNQFIRENNFANMSLTDMQAIAGRYDIDTLGLSKNQLMAKLLAIFK